MNSQSQRQWTQEYQNLMAEAREHRSFLGKDALVAVLKTVKGNLYTVDIPDCLDTPAREMLENRCVEQMMQQDDTHVEICLATFDGNVPEILSWNFRRRLMEANENNMETACFLWGGDDGIIVKPFQSLLPPKYSK